MQKILTEYNREGSVVVKNLLKKKDFKDIFDLINSKIKNIKILNHYLIKNLLILLLITQILSHLFMTP